MTNFLSIFISEFHTFFNINYYNNYTIFLISTKKNVKKSELFNFNTQHIVATE